MCQGGGRSSPLRSPGRQCLALVSVGISGPSCPFLGRKELYLRKGACFKSDVSSLSFSQAEEIYFLCSIPLQFLQLLGFHQLLSALKTTPQQ